MSIARRVQKALWEGRGWAVPLLFGTVFWFLTWLFASLPKDLGPTEELSSQMNGLLAIAVLVVLWPFLLAGLVGTWRDRLEGTTASLRGFLRHGAGLYLKVIGWSVWMGVLMLTVGLLLHMPLALAVKGGVRETHGLFEQATSGLTSWVFYALLLPFGAARVVGYQAWRIYGHPMALTIIALPMIFYRVLPLAGRGYVLPFLLSLYFLAVLAVAHSDQETVALVQGENA